MNHNARPPAPSVLPRRARRTVLFCLAVLGLASALSAVRGRSGVWCRGSQGGRGSRRGGGTSQR
ncbi:hypothetical protein ACFWIB_28510 [Streptomyces sp. NPDC127051]|uniref:hypothetical protein n=1 Tax=Streptomyces sp. NPDC127051 TaxID=3347119 RepID=UPI0036659634